MSAVVCECRKYKLIPESKLKDSKEETAGLGVMVAEKLVKNVLDVKRVNEEIMVVRVRVGNVILNLISVYAPQVVRKIKEKKSLC